MDQNKHQLEQKVGTESIPELNGVNSATLKELFNPLYFARQYLNSPEGRNDEPLLRFGISTSMVVGQAVAVYGVPLATLGYIVSQVADKLC